MVYLQIPQRRVWDGSNSTGPNNHEAEKITKLSLLHLCYCWSVFYLDVFFHRMKATDGAVEVQTSTNVKKTSVHILDALLKTYDLAISIRSLNIYFVEMFYF